MEKKDLRYKRLSPKLESEIKNDIKEGKKNPYAFDEENAIRRNSSKDKNTLLRPAFVRDIEKILHLPFYNRYADKTQVFSFYNNDDITRRGLHVQLVSRIARNIGRLLGLNLDLIEAIALGHDLGHTPFGHGGEEYLNKLLWQNTGRFFNHNVHSVRVLDKMFCRNLSLQSLDGILCHNGEFEQQEYRPKKGKTFQQMDAEIESCYTQGSEAIKKLVPSTLEGCVVRISDMIAYLGKDRQDAVTAKIIKGYDKFESEEIGKKNAEIINNLVVDIVENSYGKEYILLSESAYKDLKKAKEENYKYIYKNEGTNKEYGDVEPMFGEVYERLLTEIKKGNEDSIVYKHHITYIEEQQKYYESCDYRKEDANQIVVDYMAGMTDDYFLQLYKYLFPESKKEIRFHSYFEDIK